MKWIGWPVANIWPFEFFQDGGPPPSWIWSNSAIRSAVAKNHILEPSIKCIRWPVAEIWPFEIFLMVMRGSWSSIYSVSQKNIPPCGFLKFFPKRLGIFNQYFTHLLCDHFYTRVRIFISISPTLTKLCKWRHCWRHVISNMFVDIIKVFIL